MLNTLATHLQLWVYGPNFKLIEEIWTDATKTKRIFVADHPDLHVLDIETMAPDRFEFRSILPRCSHSTTRLFCGKTQAAISEVFQSPAPSAVAPRRNNYRFAIQDIEFLGNVVGKDGIHADPEKIEAISEDDQPLRSYLGVVNYDD